MALARVACRAQVGLSAPRVQVEVHLGSGLPSFSIVGLPATEVKESKERVRAALANSGFEFPAGRITVNLAPADLPKDGGRFDLAIAIGILLASRQLRASEATVASYELLGELGLGGELRRVQGALTAARAAQRHGHRLIVPAANAPELALLPGVAAHAAGHLLAVCTHLDGTQPLPEVSQAVLRESAAAPPRAGASLSLDDICGQTPAKRALLTAAAGGHSLLLSGPPGCGKSMLAQRLPGLLPALRDEELLEVATVASIASPGALLGADTRRELCRPFRAPHHTASASAIVGGGPRAQPGEITLAHRGVLFLDELPEFDRRVLEALREPLESGTVTVSRAGLRAEYPARFQLIAAMNPCPCGYFGDARRACSCPLPLREQYRARISGPLLDRIDLRVALQPVSDADLALHRAQRQARLNGGDGNSATRGDGHGRNGRDGRDDTALRAHVNAARCRQHARCGKLNSELLASELDRHARPTLEAERLLRGAFARLNLSMRALSAVLRIALTLADLDATDLIEPQHAAEAIQLRRGLEGGAHV